MKYLHHEAKVFDIGIYFEANGHGTVLFKPALLQRLQDMDEQVRGPGGAVAAEGQKGMEGGSRRLCLWHFGGGPETLLYMPRAS